MPYTIFLMILLALIIGSLVWLYFVKEETPVFTKQTFKYELKVFFLCAALGSGVLLKKKPIVLPENLIFMISLIVAFLLSIWFATSLYKRNAWVWDYRQSFVVALPFTVLTVSVGTLAYFVFTWMLEVPVFKNKSGLADDYALTGFAVTLLPVLLLLAHDYWNRIPIVIKELQPWIPDMDAQPVLLEPGAKALPLVLHIPLKHQSQNIIRFDIRAPQVNTLNEIFYHLLHKHNVEQRTGNKIEIAEENKRSKVYGWVFFIPEKKWWWVKKQYLDPYDKIQYLELKGGEKIYAERIIYW